MAQPTAAPPVLQAAVVGYGMAGRLFHAPLVAQSRRVRLRGVLARAADVRARAQAEHPGTVAYATLDELLADPHVDLVVVATPTNTHAALALAAIQGARRRGGRAPPSRPRRRTRTRTGRVPLTLRLHLVLLLVPVRRRRGRRTAGKHVVVDKPLCMSLAECDAIAAAAAARGVLVTVFHNRRWDGDFLTVRRLLESGTLGEVRWLEQSWHKFGASSKAWKNEPVAVNGGTFMDLGAHMVDQALLLFAAPVRSVHCRLHEDLGASDSHAQLTLGFADGRTAVVHTSALSLVPKPRYQLYGTRGTFAKYGMDAQEATLVRGEPVAAAKEDPALYGTLVRAAAAPGEAPTTTRVPTEAGRWGDYYDAVADAIARGPPYAPAVTLASVRRTMAVLFAAVESARTNRVLDVDI